MGLRIEHVYVFTTVHACLQARQCPGRLPGRSPGCIYYLAHYLEATMSAGQQLVASVAGTSGPRVPKPPPRALASAADVAADDIDTLHSSACLPHPEATPCLYLHSNHILPFAFQDFSRHDAPMHCCS